MYFRDRHGPYPDKTVTVRAIRGSSIRSKSNLTGFGPPVKKKLIYIHYYVTYVHLSMYSKNHFCKISTWTVDKINHGSA